MREVVVDERLPDLGDELQTSLDPLESAQRIDGDLGRHAGVPGGRDGGQAVADVVLAEDGPPHRAEGIVAQADVEGRAGAVPTASAPPLAVVHVHGLLHLRGAHPGDRRPAPLLEGLVDVVVVGRRDDETVAGHRAQQVIELGLDGREVGKDVRVVVLEIVDDQRARVVVHELGSAVEVGAVVLVGFHHEERIDAQP